jgi:hypothetical protein
MTGKPWYTSKTLWVNAAALAGTIIMSTTGMSTEAWASLSTGLLALVNVGLRAVTDTGIE